MISDLCVRVVCVCVCVIKLNGFNILVLSLTHTVAFSMVALYIAVVQEIFEHWGGTSF